MIDPRLLAALTGFGVSVVATGVVNVVARRVGVLDQPDASRRTHTTPTPRLGGIGVLAGIVVAIGVADGRWHAGPFLGALAFALVGFADDLSRRFGGIPASWKLGLLAGFATAVVFAPGGGEFDGRAFGAWPEIDLGPALRPMTVLWFLAVVNVLNFMDGIDALVGVTGAVLLAVAAATAPSSLEPTHAGAVGALLGFLAWNAPPRSRIFLGDGGAYLVGFLVALAPCRYHTGLRHFGELHGVPWPLVGAGLVPSIVDVAEALIHKGRHGIPLSQPHHDHLYQRLVKAGHPAGLVALRYGALALAAVAVAGPLADAVGALPAAAVGLAILGTHLVLGARATRHVPRLAATKAGP